ncbi:hypothetical protein [Halorubrum sp. T3]|uniref:hypothetical protein n=1 Tax=Halorubrum sp. T3 TaxID=1194088 RepID=UPI00178C6889|nr:hypothetical protein [Halorubrum sp. T3]
MTERGAQRAYGGLAAGALEVFAVDLQSAIYKRAAGALEEFAAAPLTIYKQSTATPGLI